MQNFSDRLEGERLTALVGLSPQERHTLATAQFRLGRQYETGRGLPADRRTARRWYQSAADLGHAAAAAALNQFDRRGSLTHPRLTALMWRYIRR